MLTITPAASSDTDEIIALRHAAEDWLAARGITQWTPREVPGSAIHRQVDIGEFFVARRRDQPTIIGACRLTWSDPDIWADRDRFAGYLHTLVIARDHAGTGLGRSLLEWAAGTARQAGADLLRLDCVETNSALCDYYLRAGFSRCRIKLTKMLDTRIP
ncbi:GNAT family N-acetyltransferase [Nocardia vinacea]|uniref:GNAT family N-acetyltransferase n=1 Tax=Nocardia vinacea TaxID=96468 RepID=UPI003415404B